jgi:hypothetical protein
VTNCALLIQERGPGAVDGLVQIVRRRIGSRGAWLDQ